MSVRCETLAAERPRLRPCPGIHLIGTNSDPYLFLVMRRSLIRPEINSILAGNPLTSPSISPSSFKLNDFPDETWSHGETLTSILKNNRLG